ncbi:MAG: hypothetical protein QM572_12960 [Nocardioides sp.]|uniref:hypothetical protein n=1 Tax=Nocardioides sp. TaxID=35761 RepID=UPI0039E3AA2E
MSEDRTPTGEPDWKRRRRLAEIFGDELPEQTSDDREEPRPKRDADTWLEEQVPPHHGKT